ncbi:hypothetical protein GGTG_12877 [Gaeumannomyces tritici R3-111a-1]|uniref:Uncharacterized protein n=1 Tax=Gaeumannomyces tritici (strain R3-111a-1) TaxID=644352 RepID=J3PH97_GAET3|nr:hypothetical protein GGTG_12877 [Gaeumannomyces tritici R3-111a-1]EJT69257.1 hypothetical protein GGTG_12877 [Gaeumannomyces tritici R3-111a-1]
MAHVARPNPEIYPIADTADVSATGRSLLEHPVVQAPGLGDFRVTPCEGIHLNLTDMGRRRPERLCFIWHSLPWVVMLSVQLASSDARLCFPSSCRHPCDGDLSRLHLAIPFACDAIWAPRARVHAASAHPERTAMPQWGGQAHRRKAATAAQQNLISRQQKNLLAPHLDG